MVGEDRVDCRDLEMQRPGKKLENDEYGGYGTLAAPRSWLFSAVRIARGHPGTRMRSHEIRPGM